ncbi:hypothetical protein V8F44DRAFT_592118 [Aspergillus fumigatus]
MTYLIYSFLLLLPPGWARNHTAINHKVVVVGVHKPPCTYSTSPVPACSAMPPFCFSFLPSLFFFLIHYYFLFLSGST